AAHPDRRSLPTRRSSDLAFIGLPVMHLRSGDVVPAHDAASVSELALAVADALNPSDAADMTSRHQTDAYLRWLEQNQAVFWELRSEEHTSELQSRENLVC